MNDKTSSGKTGSGKKGSAKASSGKKSRPKAPKASSGKKSSAKASPQPAERRESKPASAEGWNRERIVRIGFWLVLLIAAVLIIRSIAGGGDGNSSQPASAPEIVTLDQLQSTASSEGKTIYWAGEQPGTQLELSQPSSDRTFVRYLPEGVEAGDPRADFLTVGTYPFPDATAALKRQSEQPGGVLVTAPNGGVVYFSRTRPQNVYLAYPNQDIQIEVYDPDPKQAISLVTTGRIVPVD